MEPKEFVYWLQGFAELNNSPPTPEQWKSIREHLSTVFVTITPKYTIPGGVPLGPDVGPTIVCGPAPVGPPAIMKC
jgi:hypothetical protein